MSSPDIPFPEHPFWAFSLAVYGGDGVAPACLELQDRRGIDVNLLLFCLWCATERGAAYETDAFRTIAAAASDWQRTVIQPMRTARRRLKAGSPHLPEDTVAALRREVLASEIACEHGEQLIIAGAAEALPDAPRTMEAGEAVVANVLAYCAAAGLRLERSDAQALATVFAAKLPDPDANLAAAQVLDSLG
ncbi:TIGR02444 family protein [Amorphus sp. MBR-141]